MEHTPLVDAEELRAEVRAKYRDVAVRPDDEFHFHTGRPLTARLGYDQAIVDGLPDHAVESFAGIANPFAAAPIEPGSRVLDIGSGGGFDSIVAGVLTGSTGEVVGIDMTPEMLDRARRSVEQLGMDHVEFIDAIAEDLPIDDDWADVVISNGVLNLMADKHRAFSELFRVLKPGGTLQFGDIANGRAVPEAAVKDIDLWTA